MDKKKAINIIEHHLRSYKTYEIGIKNLNKSLDDILPSITTNYTLREGTNGSFDIASKVEMAVLDRLEGSKAIYLKEQIRQLETIMISINTAIEALGEEDRNFVDMRYFKGYSMMKIGEKLNTTEGNCYKIKNRIMENLFISLRNIAREVVEYL